MTATTDTHPELADLLAMLPARERIQLNNLAAGWDTDRTHALRRALQQALKLQQAANRGARITVKPRRVGLREVLRRRFSNGYEVKAAWKGPENP